MKSTFREKLIELNGKQFELNKESARLLTDIVGSMTDDEKTMLHGYNVNSEIDQIIEVHADHFMVDPDGEFGDGENAYQIYFDKWEASERTDVIEFIILNILHI